MTSMTQKRLILATHNAGKKRECVELLESCGYEIVSAGDLNLPAPEETGTTFLENARLKAEAAAKATDCLSLADDSGLCVTALDNAPGVSTADWMKPDPQAGMARILKELETQTDRSAFFVCVLVLCRPDGSFEAFEGRVDGTIAPAPRGRGGHGCDPIFIPAGETRTFAEMSAAEKNAYSHRGQASRKMKEWIRYTAP